MNLYLLSKNISGAYSDEYDGVVVAASNEEEARNIHPSELWLNNPWEKSSDAWYASPKDVPVKYLGIADSTLKKGVVLASFNAG